MSHPLVDRSPDLKRLQDDGFELSVQDGHLLIGHVPYVNSKSEVKYGVLVCALTTAGDTTITPENHIAYFIGDHPCNKDGSIIAQISNQTQEKAIGKGLVVNHTFSNKPEGGYRDFYHKMTTYVSVISNPARSIDPTVTAQTFPVLDDTREESAFRYIDTASSRAGICVISAKLELGKLAIIGVGGTGAYVVDLVSKTPVKQIHLFDGDTFSSHNAFRSPGAASIDELKQRPAKVNYLANVYSRIHRGIVAHETNIDASNVDELQTMDFVFLCIDNGESKKIIIERLEAWGKPFIDVGIGVQEENGALLGIVRVTTSTAAKRDHVKKRIPLSDTADDEYGRNIQIADLNALNAALAVIKWKKLRGFYQDVENAHFTSYSIDGNVLVNEDIP